MNTLRPTTYSRRWRDALRRTSPRTVRTRVTVVAGLALTAAVVFGLLILYLLQRQSARQSIDAQLRTYATQITQSAQRGTWPNPLPPSSLDPNAEAQVLAPDGHVLAATRTLAGLPAVYTLPAGSDTPVRQKAADTVLPGDPRVAALRTTVAGQPVTIVTATSTGVLTQLNETFARLLLIGVPGILLLAAGTVWLVVGRALRPVERIRQAVTEITAADLTRRVPDPGTADEIGYLAQTMNEMLTRLEDSAYRQRRFVADASHELRSPLTAIRTTLDVGLAHPDRAPWPDIAQRAIRQSARLEDLVGHLLLLAKADDRQLAAQRRPVALDALLRDVVSTTAAGHVDVEITAPVDAVTTGNPEHLARLFRNVLDNAIRYATGRVQVTVTTGETVRVEISDDGPGIPVDQRERVFDRFVRLDTSREHTSGSTGLGLAIAKEIAIAHGGRIAITEAPSGGACVTITLPRAAQTVPAKPAIGRDDA
jgi:signal transduction histidine kinase